MKIELNENEAKVLLQFIDIALKNQGLGAAEAALHLANKIMNPVPELLPQTENEEKARTYEGGEVSKEPCNDCSLCELEKEAGIMKPNDSCGCDEQVWCYNCNRPAVACICDK